MLLAIYTPANLYIEERKIYTPTASALTLSGAIYYTCDIYCLEDIYMTYTLSSPAGEKLLRLYNKDTLCSLYSI